MNKIEKKCIQSMTSYADEMNTNQIFFIREKLEQRFETP